LLKRIVNLGAYHGLCHPLSFKIKLKKLNNARERYLSLDEAERLLDALKSNKRGRQTYNMSLLSLFTGARFSEIASLRWADINLDQKSIFIGESKNGSPRTLFMNDEIYKMFKSLKSGKPSDLVFPSRTGKVMDQISRLFFRTIEDLRLNEGIADARQRVCFHSLRHSFCSWAVLQGCDLYRLQKVVGHKTLEMTARYSHLAPDSGRAVVALVDGFKNGKVLSLDQARKEKQAAANE